MTHSFSALSPLALGLTLVLSSPMLVRAQSPTPTNTTPAAAAPPDSAGALSNEQASYLLGQGFGEQMHFFGLSNELSDDELLRGFKDAMAGKKASQEQRQQVQDYMHSVMIAAMTRNKAAAKDFLKRNALEKGVKTTSTGLQYKVLVPGDSKAPTVTPSDEITVNYRGKLLDGSEFDSSYTHGEPAKINLSGVIDGWKQGLVLMRPGAKWQLFVPPELGYNDSPRPGIPPGSLLIFEVDLLGVKPSAAHAPPLRMLPKTPVAPNNQ